MAPVLNDGLATFQASVSLLLVGALVVVYLWRRWQLLSPPYEPQEDGP